MASIIGFFVWIIVTAVWTFIGFFFWVAILARVIAIATMKTMFVMLGSNSSSNNKAFHIPEKALTFYFDGFSTIYNSVLGRKSNNSAENQTETVNWINVILEIIWAFVFWIMIFASIGFLPLSQIFRGY